MTIIIYILSLIVNLFSINNKKNKGIFPVILTFIAILIIWVGNTKGPDIQNYLYSYKIAQYNKIGESTDILYLLMMKFFNLLNMDFFQFRFCITLICLIFIFIKLKKYDTNVYLFFILYLISVFFMDGIQIRNFIGNVIIFYGLSILYEKKAKFKYAICVIIASLFHIALLVYLAFLLIPSNIDRKYSPKILKISLISGILFYLIIFIFRENLQFLVNLTEIANSGKAQSYATCKTNYGSLIIFILQIMAIGVSIYNYKRLKSKILYNQEQGIFKIETYKNQIDLMKFIIFVNVIALLFVPFSIIQMTYYRFIRNLLLLDYVGIGIVRKNYGFNLYNFIVWSIFVGVWICFDYLSGNSLDLCVFNFFTYNKFV